MARKVLGKGQQILGSLKVKENKRANCFFVTSEGENIRIIETL